MMSPVGSPTGGVKKPQRPGTLPPPSRRKTNKGLREEDIMKRKRKEKPILQVLLIAALAALLIALCGVAWVVYGMMRSSQHRQACRPSMGEMVG